MKVGQAEVSWCSDVCKLINDVDVAIHDIPLSSYIDALTLVIPKRNCMARWCHIHIHFRIAM